MCFVVVVVVVVGFFTAAIHLLECLTWGPRPFGQSVAALGVTFSRLHKGFYLVSLPSFLVVFFLADRQNKQKNISIQNVVPGLDCCRFVFSMKTRPTELDDVAGGNRNSVMKRVNGLDCSLLFVAIETEFYRVWTRVRGHKLHNDVC